MDVGIIFVTFALVKQGKCREIASLVERSNRATMKRYKVREVIELLLADGWTELKAKHTSGDHWQFKHPEKPGKVTVRGKDNEVLGQFLLNSIWKQAGWK